MSNESNEDGKTVEQRASSLQAALARSLTRSLALYFSRPVRLFRPSKVSGWHFLQGIATQKGVSVTPNFIQSLVKQHGLLVFPRYFVPPLAINATLGFVLWTTYTGASTFLEPHFTHPLSVSVLSGAAAGAAQAIVAAPAENVRVVLEGGTHHGWSSAWKDVFLGSQPHLALTKAQNLREARETRLWMKEVGEMAGRGWKGFSWGLCKDAFGFAAFFSLFELTRQTALAVRSKAEQLVSRLETKQGTESHIPRIVHGTCLVTGGVLAGLAYELSSRPFDEARRVVHAHYVSQPSNRTVAAALRALEDKARTDGIKYFFREARVHDTSSYETESLLRRRVRYTLRVLGRVGPWGVGFLIWEIYGPGLSFN